jgi:hypothetical protein
VDLHRYIIWDRRIVNKVTYWIVSYLDIKRILQV